MRAATQFVLTVVICMAWVAACYRYPAVLIASAVAFGTFLYWLSGGSGYENLQRNPYRCGHGGRD
jgi:hypothetical protein